MISFNYESDFILEQEERFASWIETIIISENKILSYYKISLLVNKFC